MDALDMLKYDEDKIIPTMSLSGCIGRRDTTDEPYRWKDPRGTD